MKDIKGFIFDMDGVITETSKQHFEAWSKLAKTLNIEIDLEFNEKLKGLSRIDSLVEILKYGGKENEYSEAELEDLTNIKNQYYLELISGFKPEDAFDGVVELFEELKRKGIKIAIGSASQNAPLLLEKMALNGYIDYVVNPKKVPLGKPAPDIFLKAAQWLELDPSQCIGIEDSVAGVKAIKAAGMYAVGIGEPSILNEADLIYQHTGEIDLDVVLINVA